jgi:hypothetical protein
MMNSWPMPARAAKTAKRRRTSFSSTKFGFLLMEGSRYRWRKKKHASFWFI